MRKAIHKHLNNIVETKYENINDIVCFVNKSSYIIIWVTDELFIYLNSKSIILCHNLM